jgi:2-iminoacetate synthase
LEIFNKYGFTPFAEQIYKKINSAANEGYRKSEFNSIMKKINNYSPLTEDDVIKLFFVPDECKELLFNKAVDLNSKLYCKHIKFYGVVYISDYCIETCSYCGDNIYSDRNKENDSKHFLSLEMFKKDINALLKKNPDIPEICILSGDTPFLSTEKWIEYLEIAFTVFNGKIIINIQPQSFVSFKKIRGSFPDRVLQFRVFQETYDYKVYSMEHLHYSDINQHRQIEKVQENLRILYPPKINFSQRLNSQERALLAGFDEFGFGALFGLNENEFGGLFEIIGMYQHSYYMYNKYGLWPSTVSFPRILPSVGVNYEIPGAIADLNFIHLISLFRLAIPYTHLIITCRESAEFRRKVRPIINIEDFEARPGPGGNFINSVELQMEITDRRSGDEIRKEIINDGFTIQNK